MKKEMINISKSGAPGLRGSEVQGHRQPAARNRSAGARNQRQHSALSPQVKNQKPIANRHKLNQKNQTSYKPLIIIVLMLLIALPAQALAIGITPGSRIVAREPGKTFEYRGLILNNEHKDITVGLEVEGELKGFVSVEPKMMKFTKDEKQKEYTYQVMVPFSAETGSMAYILAIEQAKTESGGISAVLSVKSRITIGETPKKAPKEDLVRIDTGTVLETKAETKTTGLVIGKESKAGLFKNKIAGIILLTAGLLIMGGLLLMGVSYKQQASKTAVKKKKKKKKEQQAKVQERLLELEDYVSKCREKGVSKEQIKKDLVKKEWDEKVVDKLLKRVR